MNKEDLATIGLTLLVLLGYLLLLTLPRLVGW